MMACKARLFHEDFALSAIMATDDPREQKRLGRHVRNFDPKLWNDVKETQICRGTYTSISQNHPMRTAL